MTEHAANPQHHTQIYPHDLHKLLSVTNFENALGPHLRRFPPNMDPVDCDGEAFRRMLAVIEHTTRRIRVLGATTHPTAARV